MHKHEEISIIELEILAKAYLDCDLSRQQEREFELVLLNSRHHSPLLDECRSVMGLQTLLDSGKKSDSKNGKCKSRPSRLRKLLYGTAAAASILLIFTLSVISLNTDKGNRDEYISQSKPEVTVFVNGVELGYAEAVSAAETAQEQSIMLMNETIKKSREEECISLRKINELTNSNIKNNSK